MADVHPSAILRGDVTLAEDVVVGPGCVIDGSLGPVTIGAGSKLIGTVYLTGPLTAGTGNTFYPGACIGFAPQDVDWDPGRAGAGTRIGDHNRFSECAVIHRATSDDMPTRVGNHTWFMNHTHGAHDIHVGNNVKMAGGVQLGGHARIDDDVTIGGLCGVHQFCRIGRGVMLSGGVPTTGDVAPYFMLTGFNLVSGPNVVGIRRKKLPGDVVEDIRWAYRVLYRRRLPAAAALEALRERAGRPMVDEYIEFIESSKRGLARAGVVKRPQTRTETTAPARG